MSSTWWQNTRLIYEILIVLLYNGNEQPKNEIKKRIPFAIASKNSGLKEGLLCGVVGSAFLLKEASPLYINPEASQPLAASTTSCRSRTAVTLAGESFPSKKKTKTRQKTGNPTWSCPNLSSIVIYLKIIIQGVLPAFKIMKSVRNWGFHCLGSSSLSMHTIPSPFFYSIHTQLLDFSSIFCTISLSQSALSVLISFCFPSTVPST